MQEAYTLAVSYPVNWSTQTLAEALANVQDALQDAYPFLNQESIDRLKGCFAYAWK
ncbi:hypothetical protein [Hymenobacter elongatus]|uniref:hypothetical protein n=1 Tax=Hymenobacter elongatus TaxID=877208 RepID=UPI001436B106|nr:hypothetical protein [Hymenobacter elongatus]